MWRKEHFQEVGAQTMKLRYSNGGLWVQRGDHWVRLSDGYQLRAIKGGTSANTVMENIWAFGTDNGSESGHSLDSENTPRTTQAADENFLVRMMARETNNKNDPWAMYIYCSYNGGTWTELSTASSAGMPAFLNNDVSSRADDEETTHRLSDPASGSWTPGLYDDGTGSVGTSTIQLNGQYSEWEFCVQVDSTYASDTDEFEFRLEGSGGTDLDGGYSGVTFPKVTMSITTPTNLTVAPLSQSNTVQFITGMTKESDLVVDPLSQSNLVQVATITKESDLAIAPLSQSNLVEHLDLGTVSVIDLVVTNLSQASTLEKPALEYETELSVANLSQANTLAGLNPMFTDGFESGDTSAWDGEGTGPPTVSGAAAIDGSYGLEMPWDAVNEEVELTWTNTTHQLYRIKHKFDTNTLSGDNGDWVDTVIVQDVSYGTQAVLFVELNWEDDVWKLKPRIRLNDTSQQGFDIVVSAGVHEFEIEVSYNDGAGYMKCWLDGDFENEITSLTNGNYYPDLVWFGNHYDPGANQFNSGVAYLDSFELYGVASGLPELKQSHNLQVDDLSQSNTVEKPALEYGIELSVANLSQASTLAGLNPMFADGFESGDVSAWDSYSGTPTINGTAAIDGSYGFELAYDDTYTHTSLAWTNTDKDTYRIKHKIDINDINGPEGGIQDIWQINDGSTYVGFAWLRKVGDDVQVRVVIRDNSLSSTYNDVTLTGKHEIEVEYYFQDTTGGFSLWVDGVPQTGASGRNAGNHLCDNFDFGNAYGANATSGSTYLDSFELYDGIPSGPLRLKQSHSLQVNNLSQSNTVEKPALEYGIELSIANLSQASTLVAHNPMFTDGFESGDISAWDGTGTITPTVSGAAAIDGSYGLELPYDAVDEYVKIEWTNTGDQLYRVKFKFDTNDISADINDWIDLFAIHDGTINDYKGAVVLNYRDGTYYNIVASLIDNSLTWLSVNEDISSGEHTLEIEWDFANGALRWWINGVQKTGLSGYTSDNNYPDWVYLGNYFDPGAQQFHSGTIYLDSFELYEGLPSGLVELKQSHSLQVADLSQSNTVEKLSLSSTGALAPQTLTQATVVDKVSLTQVHSLSVDNLSQSNLVEHTTLTQTHNLSVDDLSQTNALKTQISDNFNRANGGLGPNWTTMTGKTAPVIDTNLVTASADDTLNCAFWSANTFDNDQWASARLPASSGGDYGPGIAVRISGETCYFIYYGNTTNRITLWRQDGDLDWTQIAESGDLTITPATDVWKISVVGNVITGYQNGNQVAQTTDSYYGTGQPGIWLYYDRHDLDDFVAEGASLGIEQVHNLQVDNLSQASTLATLVLTQVHELSVDNLSQSSTVDKITLSGTGVIGVQNLSQANTVEKVTLAQIHNLSIDDLSQATAVDKIPITKQSILTVADLSVSTTVEAVTLVQIHNLQVNGLSQSNLIEHINLAQLHILSVDNLSQSNFVEKVSMSGDQFLTVQNLSQANAVDKLTLTQLHNLQVRSLSQGNLVEHVDLAQLHILSVDSLSQTNLVEKISISGDQFLTVEGLSQTNLVEKVSLTQLHILSVDSLSQSNLVLPVVLTQVHVLAVDDLSQASTVQYIQLAAEGDATARNLTQANIVEKVSLTQVHNLSVDNLSQSSLVEHLDVSSTIFMTIGNLSQSNTVEKVSLTQLHVLSIDNLSQSNTLEEVILSQVHVLNVHDLSQANSVPKIFVSGEGTLVPFALSQSNLVETFTLVQQHNTAVYDLSQSNLVESIALVPVPKLVIYDLAQVNSTDYVGVTTTYFMMVYDLAQENTIELATWGAKLKVANLTITSTLWNSSFWQEQFEWQVAIDYHLYEDASISRYLYEDVTIDQQTNMISAGIDRQSDISEVDL